MKTFLSIGSGPGMGFATAERFAREGYRVILSNRTIGTAEDLAEQLRAKGFSAEARPVDAGDPGSVAALISDVEGSVGGIDVLHYNAAAMRRSTLADQPAETFVGDLAVNVAGAMAAAQAVAPRMAERGTGTILLTGGGFALQPHPDYLSLSIGKAGIRALAQGLFDSFAEKGIHVATVTVAGFVTNAGDAQAVGERFWQLHGQPKGDWSVEASYTPVG